MKSIQVLSKTPVPARVDADYNRAHEALRKAVEALGKCVSTSPPGNPNTCSSEAKAVYRYALILELVATSGLKKLVKGRRAAYASLALGLPTATLFGFPPIAVVLVFLGVLWTYFYFARLKLVGWFTLVSTLMVLLPFLLNALAYFSYAVTSPDEVSTVANELGLTETAALALLSVLLVISATSLILATYALVVLIRYYRVFS